MTMKLWSPTFFILHVLLSTNGEIRISLNSDNVKWNVRNSNSSINVTATVPGGIYSDLQKAGLISSNLFYRFNDIEYRWVGQESWIFTTQFSLPLNIMNKTMISLVFHGLDTVGSIHINGHLVAFPRNMFVRYVIPIKPYLKEGINELEVKIKSPIAESKNLFQSHNYTVPPKCVPAHYNGECHVNFLRKMQASFAWDWGPAFPSVGIWKNVEIEAFNTAVLRDVSTAFKHENSTMWYLNVTAYLETASQGMKDYYIYGQLYSKHSIVNASSVKVFEQGNELIANLAFLIDKSSVDLWWPNGFGTQSLYNLHIGFVCHNYSETSTKKVKIGMRMIELIQEKIRPLKEGLTFYFRINGVPVFAKGTNWIPSHILPERSYDENRIRSLLLSVKDAHMNIIRVWGGGLYESDLFYEIADELGIMIWQDMMYACAMYPTNEDFITSVKLETEQQIRRLQHHSSIILWAGNNENEAALQGNWYGTKHNFELYKMDYIKLYVKTIKPIVLKNDGTRPYVVSSPSNGLKSEKEGYISQDPYSSLYGDIHFYNYILDSWNSDTYQNTRFASEYGFQSLPSFKTMSEVSLPGDRKLESQFSAKRQHHLAGYLLMTLLINMRLPLPKKRDTEEFYKTFIYYSQIAQAMGVKTETEKYRRDRNKLTKNNEGRTMGAMYWQLNDVWQAPTWSSIDFSGRWKMLHYYAKSFFSPVIISPDLTAGNRLSIFIVSDLMHDILDAEMSVSIYSWNSFKPRKIITSKEQIRKNRSKIHGRYQLTELMKDSDCNVTSCFIYFNLSAPNVKLQVDNILYPVSFHRVSHLQRPNISINIIDGVSKTEVPIELTTNKIAPFVWLETDEKGQFSENGFTLINEFKTVTFSNRNGTVNIKKLKESLTVRSLLS